MSATLPGNPHADNADSSAVNRDAYVQAQATLALAHETRTLTLALLECHVAAHGSAPAGPNLDDIIRRLGA
jgi:cytochrome c2